MRISTRRMQVALTVALGACWVCASSASLAVGEDPATADYSQVTCDRDIADPVAPRYPWASPGTIHLYHYTDYSETRTARGSAADSSAMKQKILDDRWAARVAEERKILGPEADKERAWGQPTQPSYPRAAPATIHLYHYTDYTRRMTAPGSVADAREAHMRSMDGQWAARVAEERKILGPEADKEYTWTEGAAPLYPWAAPATIHLYHYTDYTRWNLARGSVAEADEHQMGIMDDRRMARMHRARTDMGNMDSERILPAPTPGGTYTTKQ